MDITIFISDDKAVLAFGFFTKTYHTAHFRHNGMIFGATSFKQVSNTWQTTGDVLGT